MNQITNRIAIILITLIIIGCESDKKETDAYGNFEADETLVSSEMSGKLLSLNINEGDIIEDNEIIGLVDTIMPALQLSEIEAHRSKISANLINIDAQNNILIQQKENLDVDLKRIENMKASGAATQKQFDDISGQLKLINKKIAANNTQKNTVKKEFAVLGAKELLIKEQLNKCRIKNPINGTVLEKFAEPGEITATGKPLYKISNLEQINLRAYVSGGQLYTIKKGQNCKVLIDKGEKDYLEYSGKIVWISDQAEFTPKIIQTKEERVNMVYAIKIQVKNDGKIKMGMPGEVIFLQY